MAGLTLRFRGNFIDVAAPALGETPRKRSDSAPPCAGRKGAPIDRNLHALNQAKHRYLASLGERAERIPSEIAQVRQQIASTLDPCVGPKAGTSIELSHGGGDDFIDSVFKDTTDSRLGEEAETVSTLLPMTPCDERIVTIRNTFFHVQSPNLDSAPRRSRSAPAGKAGYSCRTGDDYIESRINANMTDTEHGNLCEDDSSPCGKNRSWQRSKRPLSLAQQSVLLQRPIDQTTTLMLCGIPARQGIHDVIQVLGLHGFANAFDLLYMPSYTRLTSNGPQFKQLGYAFINFIEANHCATFAGSIQGFQFAGCSPNKRCFTKPALVQGFENNMKTHVKRRASGCLATHGHDGQLNVVCL